MKRFVFVLLTLVIFMEGFSQNTTKKDYHLKFKIKGLADTVIYLANYYGNKQYYKDTAVVDANGFFEFKGKKDYPKGIYLMVLPDRKSYFEFIINETHFTMETEKDRLVEAMVIKDSKENKAFYDYMNFITSKSKLAQPIKEKMGTTDDEAELAKLKAELEVIDAEVKEFRKSFIETNKLTFAAQVIKATPDPEIPEPLASQKGEEADKQKFKYFRDNYLSQIDFTDDGLLRTPIYHNKLEYYITKLTPQAPDSINKYADIIVEKARANKELFKYTVHYITNTYEKSKIMGMDAVFVHMAEKYYIPGDAFWVDSASIAKIEERATTLKPLLLGNKTPNIILQDTLGNWQNMYNIKAKYTVLYFWDPNCGHCKKVTPKLQEFYLANKEKYNLEIFAVGTEFENKDWIKYIRNNKLTFINVSDNPEVNKNAYKYITEGKTTLQSLNFRDVYDIYSTPVVIVLDADKKILGKRLGVEQLGDFLNDIERIEAKKNKEQ